MCGITACAAPDDEDVLDTLVDGLRNLEYRGYDSSGVAVRDDGAVTVVKREGEIDALAAALDDVAPAGNVGIGHTRWSTHGAPTDANAHPHTGCADDVSVVHNGIVENYAALRGELVERGHSFTSDTDTEVIPHLVEQYREAGHSTEEAFRKAIGRLEGRFAVAMIVGDEDDVFAARDGSPLVIGVGEDRRFLASDVPSFLEHTDRVAFVEDGDVVRLSADEHEVTDVNGNPVDRPVQTVDWQPEDAQRDGFDHYMLKEINEQPAALDRAIKGRITEDYDVHLEEFPPGSFADVGTVHLLACGTSYHAALYAQQLLADRGVPAQVFSAGEYTTTPAPVRDDTLVVAVTQSGETADTLSSIKIAADRGARTLAVTNVVGSTAARVCDDALFIRAGPEIGVAATKTFSSQVAVLALLAERIAEDVTGEIDPDREALLAALERLPDHVEEALDRSPAEALAPQFTDRDEQFFIGRGVGYPVALESALKFKEITYEHAEGFAAGELKHGPLALVTSDTTVFAVFTGRHDEKTLKNVEEVRSRGAPVVAVAAESAGEVAEAADEFLPIPDTHPVAAGLLANVQLQLVSYRVADLLGRSIDKPRNLAKSVTVE
ncbi:glutamine--fructose-6-phosphate transaminase (isomerizing) (plasmid) [Halolamina sp. CBA1230]|uniref:glutamine--fructose-6-phosphate transaminase (isomerizing) n=1 Tax=Halolamina sp. CBA1230 TaxID=1853690 RepID=UPI0009A1B522|nr:glutamine--fructose-6-phosphate transaminase (isomerizing) [Halolamina sp. CBA1230]QKY21989.1 glutamine--fructose-6-phosphate transaminase (isomerizing) [Halolamina sp. CBA1230]